MIAVLVSTRVSCSPGDPHPEFVTALYDAICDHAPGEEKIIDLKLLAPFAWDRVVVIGPYELAGASVLSETDVVWADWQHATTYLDEGRYWFTFVDHHSVVASVDVRRCLNLDAKIRQFITWDGRQPDSCTREHARVRVTTKFDSTEVDHELDFVRD